MSGSYGIFTKTAGATVYKNAYDSIIACKDRSNGSYSTSGCSSKTCPNTMTDTTAQYFDANGCADASASKSLHDIMTAANFDSNANYATTPSTYTRKDGQTLYGQLQQTRAKEDVELQNLYNIPGSVSNMYAEGLDSTVYTSIIWTILATSIVYYVFTKL